MFGRHCGSQTSALTSGHIALPLCPVDTLSFAFQKAHMLTAHQHQLVYMTPLPPAGLHAVRSIKCQSQIPCAEALCVMQLTHCSLLLAGESSCW